MLIQQRRTASLSTQQLLDCVNAAAKATPDLLKSDIADTDWVVACTNTAQRTTQQQPDTCKVEGASRTNMHLLTPYLCTQRHCCTNNCCCSVTRLQAKLRNAAGTGVLATSASDVRGVAVLQDVKLRVKPGNYTIFISAPDARGVQPAQVRELLLSDLHAGANNTIYSSELSIHKCLHVCLAYVLHAVMFCRVRFQSRSVCYAQLPRTIPCVRSIFFLTFARVYWYPLSGVRGCEDLHHRRDHQRVG